MQSIPKHPDSDFKPSGLGFWKNENITPKQWDNFRWQLKNRVTSLNGLEKHLSLGIDERNGVLLSGDKLALSITPHFFNLIDKDNPECPIRKQVIPNIHETSSNPEELSDPCGEDSHMPVPGLVHRYPDRVLFLLTDRCASYCRYCTRSRVVSGAGETHLKTDFEQAFQYLENNKNIRDVLFSGGDPLLYADSKLEKIIKRIRDIKHIEFIRIGTRIPIFLQF